MSLAQETKLIINALKENNHYKIIMLYYMGYNFGIALEKLDIFYRVFDYKMMLLLTKIKNREGVYYD